MSKIGNLYEALGITKTANDEEIKKAYKKMALKYHPDRNLNNKDEANTKFQEISRAFQTLSNQDKRNRYDQFGVIDGVNDNGGGGGMPGGFNPMDIFNNLFGGGMGGIPGFNGFGGGGGGNNNQQQQDTKHPGKSPDKKITINISLVDVYKGKVMNIEFNKVICCDKCAGCGAKSKDSITSCGPCGGKGKIIRMMQMGPMIQQSIQHCSNCSGTGKMLLPENQCVKCNGKKGVAVKRHIECCVRPGTTQGTAINFKNESDWNADFTDIGDLIVFVNCKNDEGFFRREADNLIMKKSITLLEALTTTEFMFKHLDERVIKVNHNEIIKPQQQMVIKNEGMSNLNDNLKKGDLHIIFDIAFPTDIDKERSKYLCKILPLPRKQIWDTILDNTPPENITHHKLEYYNTDNIKQSNTSRNQQQQQQQQDENLEYVDINTGEPRRVNVNNPVECATQ